MKDYKYESPRSMYMLYWEAFSRISLGVETTNISTRINEKHIRKLSEIDIEPNNKIWIKILFWAETKCTMLWCMWHTKVTWHMLYYELVLYRQVNALFCFAPKIYF